MELLCEEASCRACFSQSMRRGNSLATWSSTKMDFLGLLEPAAYQRAAGGICVRLVLVPDGFNLLKDWSMYSSSVLELIRSGWISIPRKVSWAMLLARSWIRLGCLNTSFFFLISYYRCQTEFVFILGIVPHFEVAKL
uniref:Uncharacterized protein n=1 Tax=Utricularia reniformis TaxID=192314 RepID=A0A1Y0B423_9LAMI|nr:hypothetical protein AEK19_MT2048 [Utricularia reniformis]ART32205.1 hypothetical protein AEK19_MT2048 [Utricularia reniformis]